MTGQTDAMIRLRTLGSVDLRATGAAQLDTVLRQPKRLALLIYLALTGPGFHRRDRLLALFWPESDEKSARGSLSQAVFQLRQALGRDAILNRGDDEIALNSALVWCDVVAFEKALEQGDAAHAMELYRGELLPSFTVAEAPEFEDWLALRRTELAGRAARACLQLADDEERANEAPAAVQWLRRAIAIQPYNESTYQHLIQLLDRCGDRAAALHVFEELRELLRNEFDAEPSVETCELMRAVRTRAGAVGARARDGGNPLAPFSVPAAPQRSRRRLLLAAAASVLILSAAVVTTVRTRKPKPYRPPPDHVAVLYFTDQSPRHDLPYLAEGLTSTLIDQLGQVRQLRVISQNGVRPFRSSAIPLDSIARLLDVGTLVGGTITHSNDRLRVTVEMIDGASGVAVHSRTLERPMGELFALLDDLSMEVSSFLRLTVGQEVRVREWRAETKNVDAWRALQQAEYVLDEAEQKQKSGASALETAAALAQADSLAQHALMLDKRFVSALVLRTDVAERRAWLSTIADQPPNPDRWLRDANRLANEALTLDDRSAAAFEARGRVTQSRWMLGARSAAADSLLHSSQRDLQMSIRLAGERPRAESILSTVLLTQGRFADARTAALRALEADAYLTDADQIIVRLFQTSFEMGDDVEAGHWCDEVRRRFTGQWPSAWCDLLLLAWSREGNHDPRKAVHLLENFGSADPPQQRETMRPRIAMLTAAVVARAGMRDSANAMLLRARAQAPNDNELLHLEAAARSLMHDDAQANTLLRDYLRWNPAARPLIENSRMFARLRKQVD